MICTRRSFGKMAAAGLSGVSLPAKPNSKFQGVQIGAITYSFRQLPNTADSILRYCTELGISSIELMGDVAESYAGAPGNEPRAGRGPASPEQQAAIQNAAEERKKWRLSVSMDKYKALRAMYHHAGVNIDVFKLPLTVKMSGDEYEYVFNATKAIGARSITMELPADTVLTKRLGEFAKRHDVYIGYHNHTQVNEHSWDTALEQSQYNTINLDVGHFTEAISASPIPFIKSHAGRITSFHLKDKKYRSHGGGNMPWGQGDTPLKDILQLMARENYRWPANIELEYEIPQGSSVMAEMVACLQFCKDALS